MTDSVTEWSTHGANSRSRAKGICGFAVLERVAVGDIGWMLHLQSTAIPKSQHEAAEGSCTDDDTWEIYQGFQRHYYYY